MMHSDTRVPNLRWNALGKAAAMIGVAAIIGFTAVSPAKADYDGHHWRDRGWRERREERHERQRPYGFGFYYSYPPYGYYSYPSYGYYPYGSSDFGYEYSR